MRLPLSITLYYLLLLVTSAVAATTEDLSPLLRVFIVAGQSNAEGKGSMKHLTELLHDDEHNDVYQHLWNGTDWSQRDDVFLYYNDSGIVPLTVGWGSPHGERFGVELEFGHVMGDYYSGSEEQHILIIKTAWGGTSLGVDWRPPNRSFNTSYCHDQVDCGWCYRNMTEIVRQVLSTLPSQGYTNYELAGLVWFQGFQDVIVPDLAREYKDNLIQFLLDVRSDFGDLLPIVIAELGMSAKKKRGRKEHFNFREVQREVTELSMFRNNTRYVKTVPYIVENGEQFDGDFHYYGRADFFHSVGKAFAYAILELLGETLNDDEIDVEAAT